MKDMPTPFFIKKIAVLGAGVMGAQIAAQCVNAGIETLLFDLKAKEGNPNGLVEKAIAHLNQLKPPPLATPHTAALLQARHYEAHMPELASCDLIIEAIAERMDWKEDLYRRIVPHLTQASILVSNTSGLSINALCRILPKEHQPRFCGVHFFNPPRYMHLAELIPAETTDPHLLNHLESWLTSYLGKGVVRAKDTPNFIANRIGVFSMLATVHHTRVMNMGFDEVDALTGPLLGRPKSATYRTMDVVGLDTMKHVIQTMKDYLKDDPWYDCFTMPEWFDDLIEKGHLGQKTGQGIYKKNGKNIEVYDPATKTYRLSQAKVSEAVSVIMAIKDPAERMSALLASSDKQAQFIAACLRDLFHYCAVHLADIAASVRDVDLALRWGFGWAQGPFETWQSSGLAVVMHSINQAITNHEALSSAPLPEWLTQITAFYTEAGAYSPQQNRDEPRSSLPVYQKQLFPERVLMERSVSMPILYENAGVLLSHLKDDIAILRFKSKAYSIGQEVIDGMEEALDKAEQQCQGVILYQDDAAHFCSGANLKEVGTLIQANKMQALDEMIAHFQKVVMRLKYSPIPTIAALRGTALGGGCEIILHCDAIVAAFEAYPGLVEVGVGVIPAGGGCAQMALRAANQSIHTDLMSLLKLYFQNIATAKTASSAVEAMSMGYVRDTDTIIMNADEVLYAAVHRIKVMNAANYVPPIKQLFKVAGIEGHAMLQAGLVNWLEGGFMTPHDYFITNELAGVLCGGNVNQGTLVDEAWMHQLERQAFITLAATPLTQARMTSILETGKPLRN